MNENRRLREENRIRAGYYQQNNYTWQYVLEPEEDLSLLSRKFNRINLQIYQFYPKCSWIDFLRYKFGPAGGDCDSSAAAMITFQMVYEYLKNGEIIPRSSEYHEYEIKKEKAIYRGDTMTSAWTPLKLYFVYKHQYLQKINSKLFNNFDEWIKVNKSKVPVTNIKKDYKRNFQDYCEYFAEQMAAPVGRVLSSNCKLFLTNVWNQGNLIPVPEFFNTSRANNEYGDTVDRMLIYLYDFIISRDDEYLKLLFCVDEKNKKVSTKDAEEDKTVIENTKSWINEVCGVKNMNNDYNWNIFVEIHFLQPFCKWNEKKQIYIPVCMSTNKTLEDILLSKKQLNFLPKSLEESECFFKTLNTSIQERSRLIQQSINSK